MGDAGYVILALAEYFDTRESEFSLLRVFDDSVRKLQRSVRHSPSDVEDLAVWLANLE